MPETPMDEDHLAPRGEDEVRLPGELGGMQPEAVAEAMGEGADSALGGAALVLDPRHALAALRRGKRVHVSRHHRDVRKHLDHVRTQGVSFVQAKHVKRHIIGCSPNFRCGRTTHLRIIDKVYED